MIIKLKKRFFRTDCHKINEDHRDWHSRVSSNFLALVHEHLCLLCV